MKRAPFAVVAVALLVAGCQDLTIVDSNRCDGEANPGEQRVDGPFDSDGDGFFDASNPDCAETYAADVLDCDDRNPDVSPAGTEEVCNGIDDDCDPDTVDAPDGDGDGSTVCDDCDDADAANTPGGVEVCDGADNDCNGLADFEGDAELDGDGDGTSACEGDCDDADAANTPGGDEVCDEADNNCNGLADFPGEEEDADCDGAVACADCDEENPAVFPGAAEACDGLDTDCDPSTEASGGEGDADGDGMAPCAGDCDDADAGAFGVDYASAVLDDGPFAYWRLGDPAGSCVAADAQGAHPLTNVGMTLGVPGALADDPDTAATGPVPADAADHRYFVNDDFALSTQALSVELWFRTTEIHTTVVSYAIPGQSNEIALVFDEVASHFLYIDSAPKRPSFPVASGEWRHVVLTWQATDGAVALWLDGSQAWSDTLATGGSIDPGGCLVLGAEQDSLCGGFDAGQALRGDMDEVAIYTRVLEPAEIMEHAAIGEGTASGVGCP